MILLLRPVFHCAFTKGIISLIVSLLAVAFLIKSVQWLQTVESRIRIFVH